LDRTIRRVMEIVGAEAELAAEAARDWLGRRGSLKSNVQSLKSEETGASIGGLVWGRAAGLGFEELPVAVQRRCVQFQLLSQGVVADFELVEQLRLTPDRSVSVGHSGAGVSPELRCAVRNQLGLVHLHAVEPAVFETGNATVELEGRAGEVEFDGARIWWQIRSQGVVKQSKAGAGRECFDADKVGSPLCLRHWRPGDRFQPIGMPRPVKLQDFFTNQRIPRGRRRHLIVAATAKGEVFWIEGMRISEQFKLTKETIRYLQWRWKRP
jgi:tRNA(Ile)-lysidine synthetase-like protein